MANAVRLNIGKSEIEVFGGKDWRGNWPIERALEHALGKANARRTRTHYLLHPSSFLLHPFPIKPLLLTAADEAFAPHLQRLLASLRPYAASFDLALFDLGLAPATLDSIRPQFTHIVTPGWDLPVHSDLRLHKPYLRAQTIRPFLPRYFPGYPLYLWLDADTWVQEKFALDSYLEAARDGALAITPQSHPSYRHTPAIHRWRTLRLEEYFGPEAAALYPGNPYYNAGAFALRADAPHWTAWARTFERGIRTCRRMISDQTALNYLLWTEPLPVHPLPATCNWCCHLAAPYVDPTIHQLQSPIDHHPLGLIHMTAGTKVAAAIVNRRISNIP